MDSACFESISKEVKALKNPFNGIKERYFYENNFFWEPKYFEAFHQEFEIQALSHRFLRALLVKCEEVLVTNPFKWI